MKTVSTVHELPEKGKFKVTETEVVKKARKNHPESQHDPVTTQLALCAICMNLVGFKFNKRRNLKKLSQVV